MTHVRIILVALSFLGGAAVPLYLAAWVLIPAEGSGIAIADQVLNYSGSHSFLPASAWFCQDKRSPDGFPVFRNVLR